MTDALAVQDVLKIKQSVYWSLAQAASVRQDRYSRSEVIFMSTVNVSEINKISDTIAREYRELEARIQAANWEVDLVEP